MYAKPEVTEHLQLVEKVAVGDSGDPSAGLRGEPGSSRATDGALIFTIHDGRQIPYHLFGERSAEVLAQPEIAKAYVRERDWGANLVARHLAREIGAASFSRINLARVVMDFGRFPGCSSVGEEYLRRHALFPPIEHCLSEPTRYELLSQYYDAASRSFVDQFARRQLSIAVHSYDPCNATGTERPEISLVARSLEYQWTSTMPPYIFDPLFPPELCESTCQRHLTYRLLADLEQEGWRTALNYPYIMPEGSVEIRAQVWLFFCYLRDQFLAAFPECREQPGYQRMWQLLLDVTRRSGEAERLRGYLHRYREPPKGSKRLFAEARRAYGALTRFLSENRKRLLADYRFSAKRMSCLGIEIRKDLLAEIDRDLCFVRLRPDAERTARRIAACMAPAVKSFLKDFESADEPVDVLSSEDAARPLAPSVVV